MDLELDLRMRLAAFAELSRLTQMTGGEITRAQMDAGFEFEGEQIRFASPPRGRGIWRPRQLGRDGVALSIYTATVRKGVPPRYDDQIASDTGWFEYRYQGDDPFEWDNVALRRAFELKRPLIYFYGTGPGRYLATFPAYIVADDPTQLTFHVAADATSVGMPSLISGGSAELLKSYATQTVKKRLHQHRFRDLVLDAYGERCTVCRLRHTILLDAAHILPDRDERGRPEVTNGLAMCKIHHGAYDAGILGITPDYRVQIKASVLEEVDGPMLQYGLQATHGQLIHTPRSQDKKPKPDYLAERYEAFRAA